MKTTTNVEDAKSELLEIVVNCDGVPDKDTREDLEWLGCLIASSEPKYIGKPLSFLIRSVASERGVMV